MTASANYGCRASSNALVCCGCVECASSCFELSTKLVRSGQPHQCDGYLSEDQSTERQRDLHRHAIAAETAHDRAAEAMA
jgi:hypothetical protein